VGGTRPFGFAEDRIAHDPAEAAIIKEAAARILGGEGLATVVRDLNGRGVTTPAGGKVQRSALQHWLLAPRTAGVLSHKGEERGLAPWDPILTADQRAELQALFRGRRRGPQAFARKHDLSGILVCGRCGGHCAGNQTSREQGGKSRYACRECYLSVSMQPADEVVRRESFRLLLMNSMLAPASVDLGSALHEIEEVRERQKKLEEDYYVKSTMSESSFRRLSAQLEEEFVRAQREFDGEVHALAWWEIPNTEAELREAWQDNGLEWRRTLIRGLFESITLKEGGRGADRISLVPLPAALEPFRPD
jgi:site-specific DNA recombinase